MLPRVSELLPGGAVKLLECQVGSPIPGGFALSGQVTLRVPCRESGRPQLDLGWGRLRRLWPGLGRLCAALEHPGPCTRHAAPGSAYLAGRGLGPRCLHGAAGHRGAAWLPAGGFPLASRRYALVAGVKLLRRTPLAASLRLQSGHFVVLSLLAAVEQSTPDALHGGGQSASRYDT